jgi:hypothetical protein
VCYTPPSEPYKIYLILCSFNSVFTVTEYPGKIKKSFIFVIDISQMSFLQLWAFTKKKIRCGGSDMPEPMQKGSSTDGKRINNFQLHGTE